MRGLSLILSLLLAVPACEGNAKEPPPKPLPANAAPPRSKPRGEQVAPPVSLQEPPGDATKTASGLIYKKLVVNEAGAQPNRNDTVLINYTGWRQGSGETFFTNRGRQPMPLNLSQTAPGFTEALQLLHKGETAVLWVPPAIGYKTPPADGKAETLIYQVEVIDITPAPAIPEDVAKPSDKATALPSGIKRLVVKPGTGKDKVRPYDQVWFQYTAWDATGRMIESTEARKHVPPTQVYRQTPTLGELLGSMVKGERTRFWFDAAKIPQPISKALAGQTGVVCIEIEVTNLTKAAHEPPATPSDVAKPPADAKKTAAGVFYRVLKKGPGKDPRHPEAKDSVKVHYTGWTTDGKMFDSSEQRGEPSTFSLGGVIAGWTDGIPVMTIGDRVRFWIPEELAYKGQAGKPQGMLVFEVELLEINPAAAPPPPGPHGHGDPHGH